MKTIITFLIFFTLNIGCSGSTTSVVRNGDPNDANINNLKPISKIDPISDDDEDFVSSPGQISGMMLTFDNATTQCKNTNKSTVSCKALAKTPEGLKEPTSIEKGLALKWVAATAAKLGFECDPVDNGLSYTCKKINPKLNCTYNLSIQLNLYKDGDQRSVMLYSGGYACGSSF